MPGWHDKTEQLRKSGQVSMMGIVEEQHPDRTRLFMQWHEMDWPVMVDSLNLLEATAVPITVLVDESGVIQSIQPDDQQFSQFMEEPPAARQRPPDSGTRSTLAELESRATEGGRDQLEQFAQALFLWGDAIDLDRSIDLYRELTGSGSADGADWFRLGVALKRRSEMNRSPEDFAAAVDAWVQALKIDPNQYIWRRRIQQYGPRLDKPYSFYDWVHQARTVIRDRGEVPAGLTTEPGGSEFAYPEEDSPHSSSAPSNPDPDGRIRRDSEGLIQVSVVEVPDTNEAGRAVRIHLVFEPDQEKKAHWNNEADDMLVWVEAPQGWSVDTQLIRSPVPAEPTSTEDRVVEFELHGPGTVERTAQGKAYALYYVCEDVDGTCLFRRQDIPFEVDLVQEASPQ